MPRKGWELLQNDQSELIVSAVSIWEIAIKFARRRHPEDMPMSGAEALAEVKAAEFDLLAVSHEHASGVDKLPFHHRDPFDRLLIAQARAEPLILLTSDRALAAYGDFVLVV